MQTQSLGQRKQITHTCKTNWARDQAFALPCIISDEITRFSLSHAMTDSEAEVSAMYPKIYSKQTSQAIWWSYSYFFQQKFSLTATCYCNKWRTLKSTSNSPSIPFTYTFSVVAGLNNDNIIIELDFLKAHTRKLDMINHRFNNIRTTAYHLCFTQTTCIQWSLTIPAKSPKPITVRARNHVTFAYLYITSFQPGSNHARIAAIQFIHLNERTGTILY